MLPDLPGWDSLSAVTRYHGWAEIAGIIFLALLVIAEVTAYRYGHRKDDLTDRQQTATNQRHDDELARLHLETAQANERAAKLQEAAAWRVFPAEVKAQLVNGLRNAGGLVEISYPANDPEALFLASQIEDIFKQLNVGKVPFPWNLTIQPRQFSRSIFWGLRIFGQNSDEVEILRRAFTSAGMPFLVDPVPNILNDSPGMMISGGPPSAATIFVGSKRPPN